MHTSTIFSDPSRTLKLYDIDPSNVDAIQSYAKEGVGQIDDFLDDFYQWLPAVSEYKRLFTKNETLVRVKDEQKTYWTDFFACKLDETYFNSRYKVGLAHARIKLPISSYCAAVSFGLGWWVNCINESTTKSLDKVKLIESFNKLVIMDTAVTSGAYAEATNKIIEEQSRALVELSTPTIQLWDGVLVLPIVGVLDSSRAQDMSSNLLEKIAQTSSRVAILDIVGVPNVDSAVASHIIKIVKATRLLGCTCIISGISPEIAQTLVQLGINLETIVTTANLQNALRKGLEMVGLNISQAAVV